MCLYFADAGRNATNKFSYAQTHVVDSSSSPPVLSGSHPLNAESDDGRLCVDETNWARPLTTGLLPPPAIDYAPREPLKKSYVVRLLLFSLSVECHKNCALMSIMLRRCRTSSRSRHLGTQIQIVTSTTQLNCTQLNCTAHHQGTWST
jgi:hypothetical protein